MSSHPRSHRPAATDYFSPTEQIELLQSIKAKAEKSATSPPQDSRFPQTSETKTINPHVGVKSVDFIAHELSLREKLEKAKADREAKAKAEAAAAKEIAMTKESSLSMLPDNHSAEPMPTGPPPPPILNNNTTSTTPGPLPSMAYAQTWTSNLNYPTPIPNYGRPPYPFAQAYPQQYGMPPYPNGQTIQPYPQWGQYTPTTSTPGVPPPPPQPNQGPPNQNAANQGPQNQIPVNQGTPVPSGL